VRPRRQGGVGARPFNFTVRWHVVNRNSVLYRTHQTWKLNAMYVGLLFSAVIQLIPGWMRPTPSPGTAALFAGVGALGAFISLAIPFFGIRCPACGSHWLWRAAHQPYRQWRASLWSPKCPECGSGDPRAPNNRWRGP